MTRYDTALVGHAVQAFVFAPIPGKTMSCAIAGAHLIALDHGYVLLPLTDVLHDVTSPPDTGDEHKSGPFWKLHAGAVELAREIAAGGSFVYFETEYFGGVGTQAAAAWRGSEALYGPVQQPDAINEALRILGVATSGSRDEFETIGLHRHRSSEDWLEAAGIRGSDDE